jgi:hypothetical protein
MIGGNCGNLLFINAVVRALMTDEHTEFYPTYYRADFSQAEIEFANETFDGFILPMADAFRDDNIQYLEGLTRFIERLKIPCYVIGVGLRAPYEPDLMKKRKSDSTVFNFVKAVLDHSTMIGVRGEVTGEYLNKLGFKQEKDYTVIGCPSVSVFLNPQISCGGGIG